MRSDPAKSARQLVTTKDAGGLANVYLAGTL
jgi:hypothetical protein